MRCLTSVDRSGLVRGIQRHQLFYFNNECNDSSFISAVIARSIATRQSNVSYMDRLDCEARASNDVSSY